MTKVRRSVFAKLVAIMLAMAGSLMVVVTIFFSYIVLPGLSASIERLVEDYSRHIALTAPDLQEARRLVSKLDLQMRYEGPDATWTTADYLPSVDDVRRWGRSHGPAWFRPIQGRRYYLEPSPNGGTYLFDWNFSRNMYAAHQKLIRMTLLVMVAIFVITYAVLRRLLRPLQTLGEGVAKLSEGQLDFVVPIRTRDEFGALTGAFNQMIGRVREMVLARDQLLLDVSHELRSPLTRMKVALELLPEGEKRQRIAADVAEMEIMISELLELERLRAGRGIKTARQDLMPLLREIAESFQERPPGVVIASAPPKLLLDVDAEKMRTVFRNLLENAVKFSLADSRAVKILVSQEEERVSIRVTDDGPGIPEDDLANLFEPFYRVDRSRSKKTGGYGLGLSICKRILEAHGGSIAVENNPGRGATFILTLPRRSA